MIQKPTVSPSLLQRKSNCSIIPISSSSTLLTSFINELLFSNSYLDRSLYSISLYSQCDQNEFLKKANLTQTKKISLCAFFWIFNWEPLTISELNHYMDSLPNKERQIQNIRIEGPYLVFQKGEHMITMHRNTLQISPLQNNSFHFDTFDRSGKNTMLEYTQSLKKISINKIPYFFDGLITKVQSCEWFAAVATSTSIYIINLKNNSGLQKKFKLNNCIDMKWGERGLYYLLQEGIIGVLERQVNNKSRFGQFFNSIVFEITHQKGFKIHRIAEVGNSLIGLFINEKNKDKKYQIEIIYNREYGRMNNVSITKELSEDKIYYCDLRENRGKAELIIVSGNPDVPTSVHQYKVELMI